MFLMTNDVANMSKLSLFEIEEGVVAVFDNEFFTGTIFAENGEVEYVDGTITNMISYDSITKH